MTRSGLFLLELATFTSNFDRFAIGPLLFIIGHDLHVSLRTVALAASVYYLIYGLMQPVWGLLSDRVGRVAILRWSLVGAAVFATLSSLAPFFSVFLIARLLTGAFISAVNPTALVYIGDRVALDQRQRALTDIMVAVSGGAALSTVTAGLLAHFLTWRIAFLVPAALSIILSVPLRRLPESRPVGTPAPPVTQLLQVILHPWALIVIGLGTLEGATVLGLLTYLAPALEVRGYNPAVAGLAVAAYGVSVLLWSRLVKALTLRWGAAVLMGVGGFMFLTAYTIAALSQDIVSIGATCLLLGGGWAFMHSTFQTWITEVVPAARAVAVSLFVTVVFAGSAVTTALAAPPASTGHYSTIFAVGALVAVPLTVGAVLARRSWPAPGREDVVPLTVT